MVPKECLMTHEHKQPPLPHVRLVTDVELTCTTSLGTELRYRTAQRSWLVYCADRGITAHDADDNALLSWLSERCRENRKRRRALISLAALRNLQRTILARDGLEGIPYTAQARPRLKAWLATYVGGDTEPKRAPALLLEPMLRTVRATLHDLEPRGGTNRFRAAMLATRDAAAIAVAWWAAFRADDASRLQWERITWAPEGVILELETSKTKFARLAITRRPELGECCPVELLDAWRRFVASQRDTKPDELMGSVFALRSVDIDRVIRRRTRAVGRFTGHSLRSGFATEAARQGIDDRLVRRHARWKSIEQHEQYVREGRLWIDTPTRLFEVPRD